MKGYRLYINHRIASCYSNIVSFFLFVFLLVKEKQIQRAYDKKHIFREKVIKELVTHLVVVEGRLFDRLVTLIYNNV